MRKNNTDIPNKSKTTKAIISKSELPRTFDISKISLEFKCKNETQKKLVNLINDNIITIASGPAGTGKSFVACAQALKLLKSNDKYEKIILVKSVTELEGESVGYLKGSLEDKLLPVMMSFITIFHKLIGEDNTKAMLENKSIEVLPLAFLRGLSLDNSVVLIDECQNITLKNMRSTLTRIGDNSKMILLGDSKQIDIKNRRLSSLDTVIKMFDGKPNIGTILFEKKDIVRNPIIIMIEDEFDKWEENNTDNTRR